jgi:hypothetical protein
MRRNKSELERFQRMKLARKMGSLVASLEEERTIISHQMCSMMSS